MQPYGGEAADLITVAQLTPTQRAKREIWFREKWKARPRARMHPVQVVHRVVARGLGHGLELQSQVRSQWDISGGCERPVPFEMNGAPARLKGGRHARAEGLPHSLVLHVRCRKCRWCLEKRRNQWAYRAQVEIAHAPRSWFVTLTASPGWHSLLGMLASARLTAGGTDMQTLSAQEQFVELCAELGREVTLMLKRLRKQTGVTFKYGVS